MASEKLLQRWTTSTEDDGRTDTTEQNLIKKKNQSERERERTRTRTRTAAKRTKIASSGRLSGLYYFLLRSTLHYYLTHLLHSLLVTTTIITAVTTTIATNGGLHYFYYYYLHSTPFFEMGACGMTSISQEVPAGEYSSHRSTSSFKQGLGHEELGVAWHGMDGLELRYPGSDIFWVHFVTSNFQRHWE